MISGAGRRRSRRSSKPPRPSSRGCAWCPPGTSLSPAWRCPKSARRPPSYERLRAAAGARLRAAGAGGRGSGASGDRVPQARANTRVHARHRSGRGDRSRRPDARVCAPRCVAAAPRAGGAMGLVSRPSLGQRQLTPLHTSTVAAAHSRAAAEVRTGPSGGAGNGLTARRAAGNARCTRRSGARARCAAQDAHVLR